MKKIVFISQHHIIKNIGGAEVQGDILATSMSELGLDVSFITDDVKDQQFFKNYKLIPAPVKKIEYKKLLKNLDADVYYQRGRKELTEWVGEFSNENGKRFLFSTSMDIDCKKYKYLFLNVDTIGSVPKFIFNFIKNYRLDRKSLRGMNQANLILTQTQYQRKTLEKRLGIKSKVFNSLHSVPQNFIIEVKKNNYHKPVILWLANIKKLKRPEVFLKLATDLKYKGYQFLMAGNIQDHRFKYIEKFFANNGLPFRYLGGVTFEESNDLIGQADILVNTSKSEGFPNTFIQAWLRGVPTVSLNVDPDNLIKKHGFGIVAGSYNNLKNSVIELIKNPSLRLKFGNNARAFAVEKFSIEKGIKKFLKIIGE